MRKFEALQVVDYLTAKSLSEGLTLDEEAALKTAEGLVFAYTALLDLRMDLLATPARDGQGAMCR